jgi:RnfABCDGE-type electron transport complex B subunit
MNIIIYSILTLMIMGIVIGVLLGIASVVFKVEVDPKIEKLEEILPGLNCGACGYPGCSGYAKAVYKGEAPFNLCTPGGVEVQEKITSIMEEDS